MDVVFEQILLVDSNIVSNFFNQIALKKAEFIKNITSLYNCIEALDLVDQQKRSHLSPDVIFLNLNAPFMNGWEFLEKYNTLKKTKESHIVVLYEDELLYEEVHKLNQYTFVKDILYKSLDAGIIKDFYKRLCKKEALQLIS